MLWTPKELEDDGSVKLVHFVDGRLFSILPDRSQREPRYTLGDEFGIIEGRPQHMGPFKKDLLIAILNGEGAKLISLGEAQQIRADHRVRVRNAREDST